jgi:hypothetical protein
MGKVGGLPPYLAVVSQRKPVIYRPVGCFRVPSSKATVGADSWAEGDRWLPEPHTSAGEVRQESGVEAVGLDRSMKGRTEEGQGKQGRAA